MILKFITDVLVALLLVNQRKTIALALSHDDTEDGSLSLHGGLLHGDCWMALKVV